jgi:hypothetical protein
MAAGLEARIKALEKKVGILDDINQVKRLQRVYSYYVQHMMRDEIVDCFADGPGVALHWLEGSWLGKEGVKRYFGVGSDRPEPPPGFFHQVMPIAGVVDVDKDGKKASGRWYAFGGVSIPTPEGKFRSSLVGGIYEIDYVKEKDAWKFQVIKWIIPYNVAIPEGAWVTAEAIGKSIMDFKAPSPDIPPTPKDPRFISGYIFPFHYTHPVTGKPTSEEKRNSKLKGYKKESRF